MYCSVIALVAPSSPSSNNFNAFAAWKGNHSWLFSTPDAVAGRLPTFFHCYGLGRLFLASRLSTIHRRCRTSGIGRDPSLVTDHTRSMSVD